MSSTIHEHRARAQPADVVFCVWRQAIEELMSIADGQVVLEQHADGSIGVDARLSVSRIGSRASPPALASLAPSIRLQLVQACQPCPPHL